MKLLALNNNDMTVRLHSCLGMISVKWLQLDNHSLTHDHAVQTQTKALFCTDRRRTARQAGSS
jgi:hypothetical protein